MSTQQIKNSHRSKRWLMIFLGLVAFGKFVFIAEVSASSATQTITQVVSDFEEARLLRQPRAWPPVAAALDSSLETSSAQAHSGSKSAKLNFTSAGPIAEFVFYPKLWGRPVKLRLWIYNQGYDFSLRACVRQGRNDRGVGFYLPAIPGWQGWKEIVMLPPVTWEGLQPSAPIYFGYFLFDFGKVSSGTIYIDDISAEEVLAEGTAGSFDFYSDHPGNFFAPGEAVTLTGTLANFDSSALAGPVSCKVFNFFGKQVMAKEFKVDVKPGAEQKFSADFGKLSRGYYEAHFSAQIAGQEVKEVESFMVLPERTPGDTDTRFGIMGAAGVMGAPQIAERLGIDFERNGLGWRWYEMDFGGGKYDFSWSENACRPLEKAGILPGGWLDGFPPWLAKEVGLKSTPDAPCNIDEEITDVQWKRIMEAWEKFTKVLFAHFKGRIHTYEFFNEVQCSTSADVKKRLVAKRIADLTIAAARSRDTVDPSIKIISPSIHSEDITFLKYFFESCPLADVNGIAYHAYRGWMWPEGPKVGGHYFPGTLTLKEGLDNFEKFFADRGVAKEIWQTEMSYQDTTNPWYGTTYVNGEMKLVDSYQQAAYLARLYLIHFTSPHHGPSIWYLLLNECELPEDLASNCGILHFDFTPKRAALAYRTIHDRLNNSKFKQMLNSQGVHAYLYRRGQTDVLAIWSEFGRRPVGIMGLPDFRIYKLDGNGQDIKGSGFYQLTVDDAPVFVESESSLDKVAVKPLVEVQLPDDIPVETQKVAMQVVIRNPGDKPWKVKLSPDLPKSITATPKEILREVPAGKEETVSFQVDLTGLAFDGWATLGVKCSDTILGVLNPGKFVTLHMRMPSGWPLKCSGAVMTSPIIVDLDLSNDGKLELIAVAASGDKAGKIFGVHADGSPVTGWPVDIGAKPLSMAAGLLEVDYKFRPVNQSDIALTKVAVGDEAGWLHLIGGDGKETPGWPVKTSANYVRNVAMGDVDGDRMREIIAIIGEGTLTVFKNDGKQLPGFPVEAGKSPTAPALGQLDGEGGEDIVCADENNLNAWNGSGKLLPGFPVKLDGAASGVALGDLDGKGKLEIVVSTKSGSVSAFDAHGGTLPGFPFKTAGEKLGSPVLADLNNDGRLEIIVVSATKIFVIQADGKVFPGIWGYVTDGGGMYPVIGAPIVVDLNADGSPEIVIPQTGYTFYSLKNDGNLAIKYYPNYAGHQMVYQTHSSCVNDIDGNGYLDLMMGDSCDGKVLRMPLPTLLFEQVKQSWWPRAGSDNYNSNRAGSYYLPINIK